MKTTERAEEIQHIREGIEQLRKFNQQNGPNLDALKCKITIEFDYFKKPEVVTLEIPKRFIYENGTESLIKSLKIYYNEKSMKLQEWLKNGDF